MSQPWKYNRASHQALPDNFDRNSQATPDSWSSEKLEKILQDFLSRKLFDQIEQINFVCLGKTQLSAQLVKKNLYQFILKILSYRVHQTYGRREKLLATGIYIAYFGFCDG